MSSHRFKVNKLVRDKLPEIINSEPESSLLYDILEETAFIKALKEKLIEEAQEVYDSTSREELINELADVSEVFLTLLSVLEISPTLLEEIRLKRSNERGGFTRRVFSSEVRVSSLNKERLNYYLNNPHKYPEISPS